MKKETIQAVLDDDIESLLNNLDYLNKIKAGHIKCEVCKETITTSNIYCFYPLNKKIKFICDNPECIIKYVNKVEA